MLKTLRQKLDTLVIKGAESDETCNQDKNIIHQRPQYKKTKYNVQNAERIPEVK